jgi:hypothetical protein
MKVCKRTGLLHTDFGLVKEFRGSIRLDELVAMMSTMMIPCTIGTHIDQCEASCGLKNVFLFKGCITNTAKFMRPLLSFRMIRAPDYLSAGIYEL